MLHLGELVWTEKRHKCFEKDVNRAAMFNRQTR